MSNKNRSKQKTINQSKSKKLLPLLAIGIAMVAIALVFFTPDKDKKNKSNNDAENNKGGTISSSDNSLSATFNDNGDIVIQIADITEVANFYDFEVNGTQMSIFAVKASDGTIRTAFDTCQICNGSPYAYFVQEDDLFQCQNCGNKYSQDMIGQERGGCNPVPIMAEEKTITDTEIVIPAKLLEDNALRFINWKKF